MSQTVRTTLYNVKNSTIGSGLNSHTWGLHFHFHIGRFSYDLEKWFRQVFVICLNSQWMKRSKHGLFVFPLKKKNTLIWRRHCSTDQSCCSMTWKRGNGWFLESSKGMKFFHPSVRLTNQKSRAFVSVRETNQIALFPFFCTLFLFCSRVFISRSYENRFITSQNLS